MYRDIEDVAQTLVHAFMRGKRCTVLMGAGCSVTAGIPTAQDFISIIEEEYPRHYERAKNNGKESPQYPQVMAELSRDEQRDLIAKYVDKAKINWGHLALAQLVKAGYVDRVLTTNFDPLVMRACAMVGEFPAVYDFATSQLFEPDKVADKAIFHLHGQRSGFILLNTPEALKEHSTKLKPVFTDAGLSRVWLVVGYSGENDPVFNHLAEVPRFDNFLYWVGFEENEPADHLKSRLLIKGKDAYYIKGYNSDSFFTTLSQKLGNFPPDFVKTPFSYLDKIYDSFTSYTFPKTSEPVDLSFYARKFIREAAENLEPVQEDVLNALDNLLKRKYDDVILLEEKYKEGLHPELCDTIAWAYLMQGVTFYEQTRVKTGEEADRLFAQAGEKYAAALKIKEDKHEAFFNWGNALSAQAKVKTGEEADRLFAQAGEKYAAALKIKEDKHEAFFNWGNALSAQARVKTGEEADRFFAQAGEKYAAALKIKEDKHEALNNWGNALSDQAKMKSGEEADKLFYQAGEKYAAALKIKEDKHEALNNWGTALADQAKMKSGEGADRLFDRAGEKYAAALKIKENDHDTLNNWGATLLIQYRFVPKNRQVGILKKAKSLFDRAEKLAPGVSAYNFACLNSIDGKQDECKRWLLISKDMGKLPERKHIEEDIDLDPARHTEWFTEFIKSLDK